MVKFAAAVIAASGAASAQDLILTFDITDPSNATVSASYQGAAFPGDFSAVNALDMEISGLTSFSAPTFDNAFLPGALPDSDPLAPPFGGVSGETVNWFVQAPTNIAPTSGSWTGGDHLIGTFAFSGDFDVSISNLSGAFQNPMDAIIGTSSVDYIVAGNDAGASYEIVIIPAPASAGLLGLAGLAAVRRR